MVGDGGKQKEIGIRIVHRVGKDLLEKPVIVSETSNRQGEKENKDVAKGKPEIFDRASGQKKSRDDKTIFGELEIKLDKARGGIKDGRILSKEEFGELLALVKETPDGKSWEMGLMVGRMIVEASGKSKDAEKIWQELADDKTKPDQRKKIRKDNQGIAMVYDYIVHYGGDPNVIEWQNILDLGGAIEAINIDKNIPEPILDRSVGRTKKQIFENETDEQYRARIKKIKDQIKVKEKIKLGEKGGWESKEKKMQAFENMLGMEKGVGVDVRGFWEKQLFEIVENRLEAMRSPTTTKLAKDGKKMEIVQSFIDKFLGRARLASRLSFEVLDPGSELGDFLNRFGALDYWRGKAAIDRMWSLYAGIPIESAEVRSARPAGEGLFNVLTKDNVNAAEVNECCGPEAELQISKDGKTCDALNILYHLAEGKTYQDSLLELKEFFLKKYNIDIDLKKELPSFVKDAVMIAYFYGLDIRANGNKDARYKSWLVGEFENIGWVTDVNGNRINLLGDAFALKPDDMVERGWYSGRNASLAFNAIAGEPEVYNPKKQSHRTEKWQSVFFYALGLDRDNKRVRHYDIDPNVADDNILPGTMGRFEKFDNNNQDHRRALFDRLAKVAKEDLGENKPSWDNNLRARVDRVLNFFASTNNGLGTNNEVWFDPATMRRLSIWDDLNLVLEDPRAWGLIGDFRDSEMQDRTQTTRYTQHNSLMHDCAAVESAGLLVKILKKIPNTLPEEMGIFPAQILEAAQEMRHRYNSELTFRNLNTLLLTTSQQAIEMFLQVQIPSREMVQKMLGEYKLFEWKRIFEGVKGLPANGTIQRSAGIEFFLRQIEQELDITETGIVGRFDDAIKMMVNILVLTEAFDWGTERDLFMNKRAFVYQYMSSWLNPGRPVEGHRVPVAIIQSDGSIKIRQLCVSDLTYREVFGWKEGDASYREYGRKLKNNPDKKEMAFDAPPEQDLPEFFTPMTIEEIDKSYGGARAAIVTTPAAGFTAGNKVYILKEDGGRAQIYGINTVRQRAIEVVEINNLLEINHQVNGYQRPGEVMLEGGRVVLDGEIKKGVYVGAIPLIVKIKPDLKSEDIKDKKIATNELIYIDVCYGENDWYQVVEMKDVSGQRKTIPIGWIEVKDLNQIKFQQNEKESSLRWVKGEWKFQREAGSRFEFVAGEGYSRVWDEVKGTMSNHEAWVKKVVVEDTKKVQIPCLKMTEDQAQKFFLHRYQILFELLTGRAREGDKPGQAMIDLDPYYEANTAFISKLIRPIKELELAVNMVQMKGALRGIVMKGEHLAYEFISVSDWAKEAYAIAKGKAVEGNIEAGQLKQIIEAADEIRNEEIELLNKNFFHKTILWLNQKLIVKGIKAGPALISWGLFEAAKWGAVKLTGSTLIGLAGGALANIGVPVLLAATLPYLVTIPIAYGLSWTFWDNGPMLSIVRAINNLKPPDFGHFFGKYFDQAKNKEDAYFPAQ